MAEIAMDSNYIAQLEFSKRVPEHYYISICDALKNLT
jgi:hypothetical protein